MSNVSGRPSAKQPEGVRQDPARGTWYFQAEKTNPSDGRRVRKTQRGFPTMAAAKRARREWLGRFDRGSAVVEPSREPLRVALPRWNDSRDLRPSARRRSRYYVADILSVLGNVAVCGLRPDHVRSLMADLTASGQAPRTINGSRTLLHRFYADMLGDGAVMSNPVALVRPLRVGRPELVVPDGAGLLALQRAAEATPWEVAVLVSTVTGMRRGEVLGLVWEDVDLDAGRVKVNRALQRIDGSLQRVEPKTKRARRTVMLPATVRERFRRFKVRQARTMLALGVRQDGDTFVCSNPIGGPLDPDAYTKAWRKLTVSVGLTGSRLHDARHAVATQAIAAGVDVGAVADVLGHADAGFTLRVYRSAVENSAERVAETMAEVLGGTIG